MQQPQLHSPSEYLKELGKSGYSEHVIRSLEALQSLYSDVRVNLGDSDSLELRRALRAILQDAIDKIQMGRKMLDT